MTSGGPGYQPAAAGQPPPAPGQVAEVVQVPTAGLRRPPRWLISLIGHIVASAVGLGMGYLVLNRLRPESFPLPW
jgi:hypothetical protein